MLLQILKEANLKAETKDLRYARIDEFNAFKASFVTTDYPINVVVPINEAGSHVGNRTKPVLQIQGWILTLIPDDASIISTEKAEQYIAPMRKKAYAFINGLIASKITDPEVQNIAFTVKPEYAFLDMLLFGVQYTVNLPTVRKPC